MINGCGIWRRGSGYGGEFKARSTGGNLRLIDGDNRSAHRHRPTLAWPSARQSRLNPSLAKCESLPAQKVERKIETGDVSYRANRRQRIRGLLLALVNDDDERSAAPMDETADGEMRGSGERLGTRWVQDWERECRALWYNSGIEGGSGAGVGTARTQGAASASSSPLFEACIQWRDTVFPFQFVSRCRVHWRSNSRRRWAGVVAPAASCWIEEGGVGGQERLVGGRGDGVLWEAIENIQLLKPVKGTEFKLYFVPIKMCFKLGSKSRRFPMHNKQAR
ncbi:hypothetical protein R3P38DRAFT_2797516 [Favolaschia claudopus]|uniref:Uncharacterized protein n=1 Tax=Favolaschia claudopus TaxID=2862362 RepID=A0AAW0A286_9AGAR